MNNRQNYQSYSKQVTIGTWIIYIVLLIFLAIACGLAVGLANSSQEIYRIIVFFVVLTGIVIIIGAYTLTIGVIPNTI